MLLRTRQLACLLVLLSSLRLGLAAADQQQPGLRATAIEALLYRHALHNQAAREPRRPQAAMTLRADKDLFPSASRYAITLAWTMPLAAAHATAARAVQSLPALA